MTFLASPAGVRHCLALLLCIVGGAAAAQSTGAFAPSADMDCLIRPLEDTKLTTSVRSLVTKRLVRVGDQVRKGQLLVELDGATIEARLKRLAVELEFNRRNLERSQVIGDLLSEKERDELETAVKRNETEIEELKAELARHRIYAPHDGVVTHTYANSGESNKDDLIAQIALVSELRAELFFPAKAFGRYKNGTKIRLMAENGVIKTGLISFVDPILDSASQTFRVHATVNNVDGRWLAGMICTLP